MHVWLIGMMGSGKSVVGKILAAKWGRETVDLDREIERSSGASIASIFRGRSPRHAARSAREGTAGPGEAAFRRLESRAVVRAAASKRPAVIATGGGAILSDANVAAMRESGHIVWLDAPVRVLARRVAGSSRPLLKKALPRARHSLRSNGMAADATRTLRKILADRRARYAAAADLRVDAGTGSPKAVAERIAEGLAPRPVTYRVAGHTTAIHVESGILDRAGALVKEAIGPANAMIVTDDVVGPLHARRLEKSLRAAGIRARVLTLKSGERHKNAAAVVSLWSELVAAGIDRRTPVLALGGGVVGDLAGFAAATILRGVPVVQVPTTLVAQVDSAIGGKTGFDLASGKNLVGAFKQPVLVIADPSVLRTLPERELRAGMAEVVKYGVILDAAFFGILESASWPLGLPMLERVVRRCAALKAGVVERDPEERGERAILNFGHTAGHALEAASGYRLRHGEAVAAGMVAEAELSCEIGECDAGDVERLSGLVARLGLPTSAGFPKASRFLQSDKKRTGSTIRMPLLKRIGSVELRQIPIQKISRLFR